MDIDPVDSAHPLRVGGIAALVFLLALSIARLFGLATRFISTRLRRSIPRRTANLAGLLLAFALFWSVINGVLLRSALWIVDQSFRELDALTPPNLVRPSDPLSTGSEQSYVAWDDLGRAGRGFVSSGPTAHAISALTGDEARRPLRVYVGLNADDTIQARVRRAIRELIRVGAFDRSVLVVITPTGTGWVDPGAIDSIEYLHRGDIASVAVQYSYLQSWISLMVDPDHGRETAEALFAEIYTYWSNLPEGRRPRLYLQGLSLGALHSQQSADLYDVIADPISGALWSGPPFRSKRWRDITTQRAPHSPAWLPVFRDSSVVRFANQNGGLDVPGSTWGPMRLVYLQHASDPVTFFEPDAAYRPPEWLNPPRGPDVSPDLRWFPIVTMLQLLIDMMAANSSPPGYGHAYAPADYVDAWVAITAPQGWTEEDLACLKRRLQR